MKMSPRLCPYTSCILTTTVWVVNMARINTHSAAPTHTHTPTHTYTHPHTLTHTHTQVHPCRQPEDLDLEETKFLMMHRTLQPEGLNRELVFQSREHFYAFAEWYAGFRRSSVRSLFYPQAKAAGRRNRRPGKDTS